MRSIPPRDSTVGTEPVTSVDDPIRDMSAPDPDHEPADGGSEERPDRPGLAVRGWRLLVDTPRRLRYGTQMAAFWLGIGLPVVLVALLVVGIDTPARLGLFGILAGTNLLAFYVGHQYCHDLISGTGQ